MSGVGCFRTSTAAYANNVISPAQDELKRYSPTAPVRSYCRRERTVIEVDGDANFFAVAVHLFGPEINARPTPFAAGLAAPARVK